MTTTPARLRYAVQMRRFFSLAGLGLTLCLVSASSMAGSYDPPPIETICAHPLSGKIGNACDVKTGVLWRGASPDAVAAAELVNLGVKSVVNLQLILDDKEAFREAKPAPGISSEIGYFEIHDFEPYALVAHWLVDKHVAQFIAIMRSQAKPVYVHCRSGQNRTGIMVAAYQIFNGMPIEEAIVEMEKYGGFWAGPDAKYLRTLTPERRAAMEPDIQKRIAKLKADARIRCSNGACIVSAE